MAFDKDVVYAPSGAVGNSGWPSHNYNQQPIAMLSDGTLLLICPDTQTTLAFFYSKDGGASWTKCSTKVTTASGYTYWWEWAFDENDQGILAYVSATPEYRVRGITFTGTDVALGQSTASAFSGANTLSMVAVQHGSNANETAVFFATRSGNTLNVFQARYNRDTNTWPQTVGTIHGAVVGIGGNPQVLLRSSVESSSVAYSPTSPEIYVWFPAASGSVREMRRYPWNGIGPWTSTPNTYTIDVSLGAVGAQYHNGFYNPTEDKFYLTGFRSAASDGLWTTHTPPSTLATYTNLSLPTTFDGREGDLAAPVYDAKNNAMRVFSAESTGASTTFGVAEWGGSDWNGATSTQGASLHNWYHFRPFSFWSASFAASGIFWLGTDLQTRIAIQFYARGGGISGWGMVPM